MAPRWLPTARYQGSACQTAAVAYLDGQPPRAFAHRGWHTGDLTGRENTLAAFRRAFDEGYRHLETDVHATDDGALIAFHDPFLDRVTDARGRVATMTWDQVRRAKIRGTDPIPLMSELFEALPEAPVSYTHLRAHETVLDLV